MKIEMSYLLLTFATVLAPMAEGQSTPPQIIESLPLLKGNPMDEQFIPVGPLLPLGIPLRDSPTNQ